MGSNNPPNINMNATSQESGGQLLPVQSIAPAPSIASALSYPASSHQNTQSGPMASNAIVGAIAYPASSDDITARNSIAPMQRRPPRNLQGLLKFAMDATQAEDAPGNEEQNEQLAPIDEQRRQFLEEALKSLTVNITEVLDNSIKVLTNSEKMNNIQAGDPLPDDVRNSFTILLDYVDDLDVANDFFKMGGFAMFPICYSSENDEVRARASSVLGTLCQNNPFCQKRALECGLLHVLLNLVQTEKGTALAKCLYAISCTSRGYEPACHELISQGGCPILVELLNSTEIAAKTKAAFLIRYFCQHYSDARKQFVRQNIVKLIASKIQAGRDESTEHLFSILQALVENKEAAILRLCRDSRYNLKKLLEDHLKLPELSDDRFVEEKEACLDLLATVFGSSHFSSMSISRDNQKVELANR